ncbi:MAG: transcriptional regulator NrdR [Thermoanaerobacteraceae bacterium]|nr:transcriptional regulator NrdR [Thermoanaerobacteraceae bacterium]
MQCPYCGYADTKVLDSRPAEEGSAIRRRRECLDCSRRFTTYERVEAVPLVVVKKDGRREMFDRGKLLGGIIKACEKRSIPTKELEKAVDDIERQLVNNMEREVSSKIIGELVMDKLKELDEVAYVRFASVYRQFKDIQTFMKELEALLKNK